MTGGRRLGLPAVRRCRVACRVFGLAAAAMLIGGLDLPRVPLLEAELGASPAFAKNERSAERSERGDRGRGRENRGRGARSDHGDDDRGRRVWNRPRDRDHADNGRHLGHGRSSDAAERRERRTAAAPSEPPLPPRRPRPETDGFRNHGDRVSTFVALAKQLGFSASVGAMQGNFGTPFENDLVARDPVTGEFLKDPDTGEFIIDASEAEIAAVKPGNGPRTGWETETDLDVNMDGVVDATDLELARQGRVPQDHDDDDDGYPTDDGGQTALLRSGREDGQAAP